MKNTNNTRGLNELWEETEMKNELSLEELISQVMGEESDNEEENEMNEMNNNAENSVNELQEETTMDQQMSLNEWVIETCFDEIGIDNEISMMSDEEWNEWTKENRRNYLEEIKERKERRKMAIKSVEIRKKALKSLKESAALAQQRGVEDEKILKNETDIDNYFMSVDVDTKDNYEEETTMNNTNNNAGFNELWEEITAENEDTTEETVVEKTTEVEAKEGGFDASSLIHKGNILIACPSSLYAYKEAIVLLRDVEGAIDKTGSYTTKLSLESIKDGLMNLIAEYEDTSGMTNKKKQLADKVAGLKEVTAEKVSQAKAAIDNIDEDNEYYQKGVEVTEKAKAKYNEVLGNVFNRLKL